MPRCQELLRRFKTFDLDFGVDQATLEFLLECRPGDGAKYMSVLCAGMGGGLASVLDVLCGACVLCRGPLRPKLECVSVAVVCVWRALFCACGVMCCVCVCVLCLCLCSMSVCWITCISSRACMRVCCVRLCMYVCECVCCGCFV